MRKKHEQSVIDGVFQSFHRAASRRSRKLIRCSMDGQDAIYGGDYIFAQGTRFLLIEFKYEDKDLKSEKKKSPRLHLCQQLDQDRFYRKISLDCHYIGWSQRKHTREVFFNQYYSQICNQQIFGHSSKLKQRYPKKTTTEGANSLFDYFLDQNIGSTYYSFKKYTAWLRRLKGEKSTDMELIIDNPNSEQLDLLDFHSLEDLKLWIDYYF